MYGVFGAMPRKIQQGYMLLWIFSMPSFKKFMLIESKGRETALSLMETKAAAITIRKPGYHVLTKVL